MDWPVLADPFNSLGISAVPITLLIDQHGIIRYKNPKSKDLKTFLAADYSDDAKKQAIKSLPEDITSLENLLKKKPTNAVAHFRLGVAYRLRFDSTERQPTDFSKAMSHWETALKLNPNQYIWRRRIQQYGPRLDKPYSFYDWVATARRELIKNGEKPIHLIAEPSGAEFATPAKSSRSSKTDAKHQGTHSEHPDPENKVHQDTDQLITTSIVKVSSTNKRRAAIRVHLTLTPSVDTNWTNDAGNISCYLTPNSGAKIQDLKIPELPNTDNSSETRVIEFEVHPKNGKKLPESITTTVFYYVCTEADHTCKFLRKDIVISLKK